MVNLFQSTIAGDFQLGLVVDWAVQSPHHQKRHKSQKVQQKFKPLSVTSAVAEASPFLKSIPQVPGHDAVNLSKMPASALPPAHLREKSTELVYSQASLERRQELVSALWGEMSNSNHPKVERCSIL
ncbi:hypothetical protein BX616_001060 [Lobosporangium transversale]|nr:hypothetical protein BX616_001060 [Lobosporangium transversale]